MVCIGTGPGPKNVLVEFADGTQMCVPYAIYKHKIKEFRLSDKEFATAVGFVQFDVKTREANNQEVRDVVIKTPGKGQYIRITVWPEFDDVDIEKGDFIAVDGVFTSSVYQDKEGAKRTSLQISARTLFVGNPAPRAADDRESDGDAAEAGDLF